MAYLQATWPSILAIVYSVMAMAWIASYVPPPPPVAIMGYGMAALGYALFAAGILRGTFLALGLRGRWRVIAFARWCNE